MRFLIILILMFPVQSAWCQFTNWDREAVDVRSYQLYLEGKWDSLIQMGNEAILHDIDFISLRLRIGFAFIQKNQFSKALPHYYTVLNRDKYNESALYYTWYAWTALNQPELATSFLHRLPNDPTWSNQKKAKKLLSLGYESSYKRTSTTLRSNAWFQSFQLKHRIGYRWQMQHVVHSYQQTLNEPKFTTVENNTNIAIHQLGIYHQSVISIHPTWQLKLIGQYFNTPFNNLSFQNWIAGGAVKYIRPKIQIQASFFNGMLTDSSLQQFDLSTEYQPLDDSRLYGITTISAQQRSQKQTFNLKQAIGVKISNNLWLEGNITFGKFSNRLENEGLYVYNAVDVNQQKWGFTGYWNPGKHLQLKAGYLFEQRTFFLDNNLFSQHALNTSITWTF
jgi:hypothetical protein